MKNPVGKLCAAAFALCLAVNGVAGINTGPVTGGGSYPADILASTLYATNNVEAGGFVGHAGADLSVSSSGDLNLDAGTHTLTFQSGNTLLSDGLSSFSIVAQGATDLNLSAVAAAVNVTANILMVNGNLSATGIIYGNGSGLTNIPSASLTLTSNLLAPSSISFPATTVNWTNTTGNRIFVFINNSAITGTAIKINGTTVFTLTTGDCTLPLQPGEYFSETYTVGTPTATIKPF